MRRFAQIAILLGAATALAADPPSLKLSEVTLAGDEELIGLVDVTQGNDSLGTMTIRLHHKYAPVHVRNFVKLAETGFYDGTKFHRTGPESFVQGGDPLSRDGDPGNDGTGGPGWDLVPEINDKPFVRGTVGAAKMDKRDNGSQFFICLKDHPEWDKQYTPFASVISGLDVADKIAAAKRKGEHPVDDFKMRVRVEKRKVAAKLY